MFLVQPFETVSIFQPLTFFIFFTNIYLILNEFRIVILFKMLIKNYKSGKVIK